MSTAEELQGKSDGIIRKAQVVFCLMASCINFPISINNQLNKKKKQNSETFQIVKSKANGGQYITQNEIYTIN